MPTVNLDPGGPPDNRDIKFDDGPLFGNASWNVAWYRLELRQILDVPEGPDTHHYKVAGIEDAEVICDFIETV